MIPRDNEAMLGAPMCNFLRDVMQEGKSGHSTRYTLLWLEKCSTSLWLHATDAMKDLVILS
jgi:hypothetical protein